MIKLWKGEETGQCTLEQKADAPLSHKIWEIVPCEIKNAKLLWKKKKNKIRNNTLDNR